MRCSIRSGMTTLSSSAWLSVITGLTSSSLPAWPVISYLLSAVATSTAQATLNLPSGCYRFRFLSCELCVWVHTTHSVDNVCNWTWCWLWFCYFKTVFSVDFFIPILMIRNLICLLFIRPVSTLPAMQNLKAHQSVFYALYQSLLCS